MHLAAFSVQIGTLRVLSCHVSPTRPLKMKPSASIKALAAILSRKQLRHANSTSPPSTLYRCHLCNISKYRGAAGMSSPWAAVLLEQTTTASALALHLWPDWMFTRRALAAQPNELHTGEIPRPAPTANDID